MSRLSGQAYVGFPPRSGFLMLPRASARAARAGLALYEPVEPRQRIAARAGSLLLGAGLTGVLPAARRTEIDWGWWERWLVEVAEPRVGPVAHLAFRVPASPRVCVLALGADGGPLAFGKILSDPAPGLSAAVHARLAETRPLGFAVPEVLDDGMLDGVRHRLQAPLPPGRHRRPPHDPARVRAVIDEFRALLAGLPRPPGAPPHHVVCHTEFTPRNLRVAADGRWWLIDWDSVRWGPPLADELRYWSAELTYRGRGSPARHAGRVYRLLRERGSDADILEAARWPGHPWRTYRLAEEQVHELVAGYAGSGDG